MASSLIDSMAGDFDPDEYTDDYRAALQAGHRREGRRPARSSRRREAEAKPTGGDRPDGGAEGIGRPGQGRARRGRRRRPSRPSTTPTPTPITVARVGEDGGRRRRTAAPRRRRRRRRAKKAAAAAKKTDRPPTKKTAAKKAPAKKTHAKTAAAQACRRSRHAASPALRLSPGPDARSACAEPALNACDA